MFLSDHADWQTYLQSGEHELSGPNKSKTTARSKLTENCLKHKQRYVVSPAAAASEATTRQKNNDIHSTNKQTKRKT